MSVSRVKVLKSRCVISCYYFIKSIFSWSNQSWTHLSLSNSADPRLESAFLGYLLRRRVLSIETLTLKANDSMIVAVNWLNRIHAQVILKYVSIFISKVPIKTSLQPLSKNFLFIW